jgi:hypothetical protein
MMRVGTSDECSGQVCSARYVAVNLRGAGGGYSRDIAEIWFTTVETVLDGPISMYETVRVGTQSGFSGQAGEGQANTDANDQCSLFVDRS